MQPLRKVSDAYPTRTGVRGLLRVGVVAVEPCRGPVQAVLVPPRGLLRLVRDGERAAGLVTIRPDGNQRLYRARTEGLAEVWQFIDEMWTDRLARLKQVAERAASETSS
jgi:hypothetical protein